MKVLETGLIIAGGVVAAGAAVYAGVKIYKNYSRKKVENMTYTRSVQNNAGQDFADCAGAFSGLYEPLYMMGKGKIKFRPGVIGDWATRTTNLSNADDYKNMWNSRFSDYSSWDQETGLKKANELLAFVISSGVCRDTAEEIIVDSTTYRKYGTLDDEMIEEGNTARVKTPYWFIGDKILEKGVIEKF